MPILLIFILLSLWLWGNHIDWNDHSDGYSDTAHSDSHTNWSDHDDSHSNAAHTNWNNHSDVGHVDEPALV